MNLTEERKKGHLDLNLLYINGLRSLRQSLRTMLQHFVILHYSMHKIPLAGLLQYFPVIFSKVESEIYFKLHDAGISPRKICFRKTEGIAFLTPSLPRSQ